MRRLAVLAAVVALMVVVVGCDYTKKHHESLAVVHSPGISGHNVTIPYTLLGTELTGIDVKYSVDGHFWFPTTRGWGGEGVMGLQTSVVGVNHTWSWDSLADIGPNLSLNVLVKIVPWGRGKGNIEGTSPVFIVNNAGNTRPSAIIISSTGTSGDIIVQCGIADGEADAVTATLQVSIDGGTTFFDARLADAAIADRLDSTFPTEANDGGDQLSYWKLPGIDLAANTGAAGKIYVELSDTAGTRKVSLYSDSAKTALVAEGTLVGDGTVTLTEQNSSGLSGSVIVAYTTGDLDVELTCYKTHSLVWDSLLDIGPNNQPDVRLRVEVVDGEVIYSETKGTTPSYTPDTSPVLQTSVDNTGL